MVTAAQIGRATDSVSDRPCASDISQRAPGQRLHSIDAKLQIISETSIRLHTRFMTRQKQFLSEISAVCSHHERAALITPLQAVGTAVFPQLLRVEEERITHASHPIRVLPLLFAGLVASPAVSPEVELALGISCLCHDASAVKKKSTTGIKKGSASASSPEQLANEEESRRFLRMLHEADGVVELIKAVTAANALLKGDGCSPIGSDALEVATRICAVHDTPSLRSRLPLDLGTPAGAALGLFVQADSLAMVEYGDGLRTQIPVGPMVEPWARGEPLDKETVGKQAVSSLKSLRSRLGAAFGLNEHGPLRECFPNRALGEIAERNASMWQAELGEEFGRQIG